MHALHPLLRAQLDQRCGGVVPAGLEALLAAVSDTFSRVDAAVERRANESTLERLGARLAATLNALPDLLFAVSRAGEIVDFRAPQEAALYAAPVEFLGRPVSQVLPPDVASVVAVAVERTLRTGACSGATYSLRMGDGPTQWFELTGARQGGVDDPDARAILLVRDITQRKDAEDRHHRSEERLNEVVLLAMMSHEIRTPLNGINGVLHLLRGERLTDEQSHWVDLAHASATTLLRVINDILDFSKIEAGKLEIRAGTTDLHALVYRTADTFAESATTKQLGWAVTVDPDVPRLVHTDEDRVSQVLGNLINNAVKFTDAGSVTVHVGRTPEPGWVRFEVTDTGHGVAPELQDRLFKPFSQLDSSNSRRHGGTGLGLGICKHLVELLDGHIGMEGREPGGCTFWFELPLPPAAEVEAEVSQSPPLDASPAGRLKVLVAEDNPINQLLAREMVQRAGYDCDCVGTGREAVVAASTGAYASVLMDCMMPELDGFDATRLIRDGERANPESGHLPIIALTARAMAGDKEDCLAAGMDDYLSKPFSPDEVANILRRWTRAPGV